MLLSEYADLHIRIWIHDAKYALWHKDIDEKNCKRKER